MRSPGIDVSWSLLLVVHLTLDIAHGEINGKDDGQTDHSDDEDKNNQMTLKPENQDDDSW